MERWNTKDRVLVSRKDIDEFLDELFDLYERHGFSISHEDTHGSFIIEKNTQENREWMKDCSFRL